MSSEALRGPYAAPANVRKLARFDRDEWPRLAALFGFVLLLHVIGFGLFLHYNSIPQIHALRGGSKNGLIYATAAAVAYGLGLRHAFDADHIAAIDDTTRYLLQKGKRPLGVGFFFSLGHSSVVMALSVGDRLRRPVLERLHQELPGQRQHHRHPGLGRLPLPHRSAQLRGALGHHEDVAGGQVRHLPAGGARRPAGQARAS